MAGGGNYNAVKEGTWNVICQRCNFKVRSDEVKKEWTGLYVCKKCWEPRHPQDRIRGIPDDQTVPFTFPDSNTAINGTDPSGNTIVGIAGGISTVGDADATFIIGTTHQSVQYTTTLTANRTITLDTTGLGVSDSGDRFIITRTAGGAFTLDVGGLYTIPASLQFQVTVEWTGISWTLTSTESLGI